MDIFRQYFWGTGAASAGYVPLAHLGLKAALSGRASGACGLFCAVFPYYAGRGQGNISLYARGQDYHAALARRLSTAAAALKRGFPDNFFEIFVDASPFPEARASALCGLGKIGANDLLIAPKYGSFIFIGTIATDLSLDIAPKLIEPCRMCGQCESACPVALDKISCLSHLTQKKGVLTPEEQALVRRGGSVWGCDLCQLCCPENRHAAETALPEFRTGLIASLTRGDLPENEQAFAEKYKTRAFCWRGLDTIKRNVELLYGGSNPP